MLAAARIVCSKFDNRFVIIVGDGCSPRTGVVFAYFTRAKVISIDPSFNMKHWAEHVYKQTRMGNKPERIKLIKNKVENIVIDCAQKPIVVVWPHSHANMDVKSFFNYSERIDIAMPCCKPIPKNWSKKPHITYDDHHVLSPKRTVHIWKEPNNWHFNKKGGQG
jgi:hypothetical protein